jgi:hypothetical protein
VASRVCTTCQQAYDVIYKSGVCSPACLAHYHHAYMRRKVEIRCARCRQWRYGTYQDFRNWRNRRHGCCIDCKPTSGGVALMRETDDDWKQRARNAFAGIADDDEADDGIPDIEWIIPPCRDCAHGTPEPASWLGYKCSANAAVCQPKLYGRLFRVRQGRP